MIRLLSQVSSMWQIWLTEMHPVMNSVDAIKLLNKKGYNIFLKGPVSGRFLTADQKKQDRPRQGSSAGSQKKKNGFSRSSGPANCGRFSRHY